MKAAAISLTLNPSKASPTSTASKAQAPAQVQDAAIVAIAADVPAVVEDVDAAAPAEDAVVVADAPVVAAVDAEDAKSNTYHQ